MIVLRTRSITPRPAIASILVATVLAALASAGCDGNDGGSGPAATVTVLRVDARAAGGGDGRSWSGAYNDLAAALAAAAALSGEREIWVAAGTYTAAGDAAVPFQMVSDTGLYGGFAGSETTRGQRDWRTHETILDGNGALHVIEANLTSGGTLDGFTITGGNASTTGADGGGAYFVISAFEPAPTVRNCRFVGNSAEDFGGGLYCNRNTRVVNCDFIGNTAHEGGGLHLHGGENELNLVANCRFLGNGIDASLSGGGGLSLWSGGESIVTNCLFSGNVAGFGGGLTLTSLSEHDATIVANCTFSRNRTPLSNGVAGLRSYGSTALVANNIFWENTNYEGAEEIAQLREDGTGALDVRSCTIDSLETYLGNDNNAGNPAFMDADGPDGVAGTEDDDLRLGPGSLAGGGDPALVPRDAGDLDSDGDTSEATPVNLAGEPRSGSVNRGAY